jgi:hypothetical protein
MRLTISNYQKLEDYKYGSIEIREYSHLYEISIYSKVGNQTFLLGRTARTIIGDIRYELHSMRTKESKWISIGTIADIEKFIYVLNHFEDIPVGKPIAVGLKRGKRLW